MINVGNIADVPREIFVKLDFNHILLRIVSYTGQLASAVKQVLHI